MVSKDIETFLAAKRQESIRQRIHIAVIGVVLIYVVFLFLGLNPPFAGYIVSGIIVGALSFDLSGWSKPTTTDLLEVIERQINSDPNAIRLLAEKNAKQG